MIYGLTMGRLSNANTASPSDGPVSIEEATDFNSKADPTKIVAGINSVVVHSQRQVRMVFLFQILVILSILILLIGMIKPKWIMFWSAKPDRFMIMVFAVLLFMGSFTGYSEFRLRAIEAESAPVFPSLKARSEAPQDDTDSGEKTSEAGPEAPATDQEK